MANIGVAINITRPADTTTYAAGDVVGGVLQLGPAGMLPAGGDAFLTTARFEIDVSAVPSGMTSFRLHLYYLTPPSALADNSAWDLPSGDRDAYRGYIDLGSPVDVGSTLYVETTQINKHLNVPANAIMFAYLVTNGSYQPTSAAVHRIRLHGVGVA